MGLTGAQILRRVELPLALPLVFGGIKTSTVNVIATATLGPAAGVVTLGDPIINPSSYGDAGRLGAAIVVAALAIAAEVGLSAVPAQAHARGPQSFQSRRRLGAGCSPFPRGGSHPHHEQATHSFPRSRPCSPSPSASPRAAATTTTTPAPRARRPPSTERRAVRGDQAQRRQREDDPDGRLEELHRAEGARRDLRPGLPGRRLHRQEGAQPRRREDGAEGGQDRPDLRLPGVHGDRPAVVPQGPGQGHPERRGRGLRAGQDRHGQAGHRGLPADALHLVQRGRAAQEEGRRARGHEDLRPQAQGRPAHAVRLARVPHAPGLPAGPRAGLRPEVQEVRARSTSTSATRC